MKKLILILALAVTGCTCVTVEHAANVEQLHENVALLMPYAEKELKAEVATLEAVAADGSRADSARAEAKAKLKELKGLAMTAKLTPNLSRLITDWSTKKVDADKLKAEQDRRAQEAAPAPAKTGG